MDLDLLEFNGAARCPDGYETRPDAIVGGLRLFPRSRAFTPVTVEPGAYHEFSQLEPRDILAFASRYGTLVTPPGVAAKTGEDFDFWTDSINAMKMAVAHLAAGQFAAVCETINEKLSWPNLSAASTASPPGYTVPRGVPSKHGIQMRLFVPNLDNLLWMQFLTVVAKGPTVRQCRAPRCGRWMIIGVDAYRKSRATCSDPCKVAFNAHLRGMALRLHEQGKTDRAIVLRLKAAGWQPGHHKRRSPEKQIANWLKEK